MNVQQVKKLMNSRVNVVNNSIKKIQIQNFGKFFKF